MPRLRTALLLATCGLILVLVSLKAGDQPAPATYTLAPGHSAAGDREKSDAPLGSWQVTKLPGVRLVPDHELVITLKPDRSISGHTGCNTFGSQLLVTATGISITNNFMIRVGCEEARHAAEKALLEALDNATAFGTDGDVLTLIEEKGQTLGAFELMEEPSNAGQAVEQATPEEPAILFRNVRLFDGNSSELSDPSNVLIKGSLISTISTDPIDVSVSGTDVTVIDGNGGTLMPGLIDAHWSYPGKLGVVEEGALADILLVEGNPLEDLSLIIDAENNLLVIMKDGVVYKNTL